MPAVRRPRVAHVAYAVGLAWSAACAPPGTGSVGRSLFAAAPSLLPVDPDVPLVRRVEVDTVVPAEVRVSWEDADGPHTVRSPEGEVHVVPILRLRPDTAYDLEVEATSDEGSTRDTLSFRTDPLPDAFAAVHVRTLDPAGMEPGDTLLALDSGRRSYHVVLTPEGEVVWLWAEPSKVMELQLVGENRLLGVEEKNGGPFEISWTGEELRRYAPAASAVGDDIPVDVRLFSHDVQPLADGALLALTNDAVVADRYPASYTDPSAMVTDEKVRADRVVVLAPDGDVRESYPLTDHVPLDRIGFDGLWDGSGEANWGHTNGMVYSEEHDAFLVSMRNQDALISIDHATGQTRWILANPANWEAAQQPYLLRPVGSPFRWPYHQHAPEWTGDRVMVHDNGNYQASPWTGEAKVPGSEVHTRIVEYRVDEQARTVEQLWAFEPPGDRIFAPYVGDADHLEGGTVLADFAQVTQVGGEPVPGGAMVRLVEFVPETGEVVWDVELTGQDDAPASWISFRAQRLGAWTGEEP